MRALRAVLEVLRDLLIGDDWRITVGIVAVLGLSSLLAHHGLPAWWLPPVAVVALLGGTVRAARPRVRPQDPAA
ncbi:MAG TPA: hypothetical protein VHV82_16015 [Sporichthyaceae bacterium]|nr:hypothetical protein [Sporichthyaceae bacterium]